MSQRSVSELISDDGRIDARMLNRGPSSTGAAAPCEKIREWFAENPEGSVREAIEELPGHMGRSTVSKHAQGECSCPTDVPPVRYIGHPGCGRWRVLEAGDRDE